MTPTRPGGVGRRADDGRRDAGSATIWVLSCCVLLMVIAGVVTVRGVAVLARHRAESSADLAALAAAGQIGVSDGACAAAGRIARQNGTRLRTCRLTLGPGGRSGTVVVSVALTARLPVVGRREVVASARAGRLLGGDPLAPSNSGRAVGELINRS